MLFYHMCEPRWLSCSCSNHHAYLSCPSGYIMHHHALSYINMLSYPSSRCSFIFMLLLIVITTNIVSTYSSSLATAPIVDYVTLWYETVHSCHPLLWLRSLCRGHESAFLWDHWNPFHHNYDGIMTVDQDKECHRLLPSQVCLRLFYLHDTVWISPWLYISMTVHWCLHDLHHIESP